MSTQVQKAWKTGLVIGKFYPFTEGHSFLITTAKQQVERLYVLVCEHTEQHISGQMRMQWIQAVHPDVTVSIMPDILNPDDSEAWAHYTRQFLDFTPDVVFTSECGFHFRELW